MKKTGVLRIAVLAAVVTIALMGSVFAAKAGATLGLSEYLSTGKFRPAFDHMGNIGQQIDSVAASGCTVNYAGLGACVYNGLPAKAELQKILDEAKAYNKRGHSQGVPVMLSYLCATSIVNADTFTKNWKDYLPGLPDRIDAHTLLQQDINGGNLPSWYDAPYNPADMWNPVWRRYQKFLIKLVVQCGFDGVFYDNPTVHTRGNYSQFAMRAWSRFLKANRVRVSDESLSTLRELTKSNPRLWLQFRATEAADFLKDMRSYGRSIKPGFILTANNSLNVWDSFYTQPRSMGYSIFNQSQCQDFITIEDMSSSPRRDGATYTSYASTIKMVHAIGHGRPISACTIANGNYTTPPNMMKLAIAECAANDAAYMVWACWDEHYRQANAKSVRQYHDFMGKHQDLFKDTKPISDVALIWPYDNWLQRDDCPTAALARSLSASDMQYDVVTEDDLTAAKLSQYRYAIRAVEEAPQKPQTQKLLSHFSKSGGRTIVLVQSGEPAGPRDGYGAGFRFPVTVSNSFGVRASVRRSKACLLLHLYNLNVVRIDDYNDKVEPADKVTVSWLLPKGTNLTGLKLQCLTPDTEGYAGNLPYTKAKEGDRTRIDFTVPSLHIWSVIRAECGPVGGSNSK